MSNSSLATYKRLTGNYDPRNHKIDTITIHCYVGQVTAKQGCDYFYNTDREVSSNYVVGRDGSIGLSVEEKNRAWTSSSPSNDHRAITIETACDTKAPYKVNNAAYNALINLCVDICKRNGIKKLVWSNNENDRINHRNGCNMTVHRDFASTDCPGKYLMERMADIANQVNKKLGAAATTTTKPTTTIKIDAPSEIGGNDMTRGYFRVGDRNEGVYTYKQMLMLLKKKGIIAQSVDNNEIFGAGTKTATKQVQLAAGITVDGLAGPQTIRACYVLAAK
nr:MAG TPA: N-acetylmuramoyl-L-alanine amidase [Caudoviricetes sp.]